MINRVLLYEYPKQSLPASGRWSFSLRDDAWSETAITVKRNGTTVSMDLELVDNSGNGDRTIVWKPQGGMESGFERPLDPWQVEICNIRRGLELLSFNYTVLVFDAMGE